MDDTSKTKNETARTLLADVTTAEQALLAQIETLAAADALTEDDRQQLSYQSELLCAELRACIDPSDWE